MRKCNECEEQARLLGMSAEREYKLRGEIHRIKTELLKIENKYDTLAVENMLEVNKLCGEINSLKNAIKTTLEENRHLADGDDCTLKKLKLAVPDWK